MQHVAALQVCWHGSVLSALLFQHHCSFILLQAAKSDALVSLLRAQGLSPLMRQYIMYAVAMADSDQETMFPPNTHPNAEVQPVSQPTQPAASTDISSFLAAKPLGPSAASATHPAAEAASAHDPNPMPASSAPETSASMSAVRQAASQAASNTTSGTPLAPDATTYFQSPPEASAPHAALSVSAVSAAQPAASGKLPDGVMSVEHGIKAIRQYLSSVGRYGPSSGAFLTPMYGCAELPQAFCR